jgi:hypothetical protein
MASADRTMKSTRPIPFPRLARAVAGLAVLVLIAGIPRDVTASVSSISSTAQGVVSGGGTVTNTCGDASFGLNSVRPSSFPNGQALGRINYERLGSCPNAHVNVPVVLKAVTVSTTPSPNGTGGDAAIIGNCAPVDANTLCPSAPSGSPPVTHVMVVTRDVADDGAGQDLLQIVFLNCTGAPVPPSTLGATPSNCTETLPSEGGLITTGNVQVRLQ